MTFLSAQRQLRSLFFTTVAVLSAICLIGAILLGAVKSKNEKNREEEGVTADTSAKAVEQKVSVLLTETADAGLSYQNKLFFFGESTTAHLARNNGVLAGTRQVWKDDSGTRMLNARTASELIRYETASGEIKQVSFADAVRMETPEYLVLSFGLNGIIGFVKNPEGFLNNYRALIAAVQTASPNTKIILQSIYPVSDACTDFSVDAQTVNSHIRTLNARILELAESENNVRYADTGSLLTDSDGMLASNYDNGDGIHLTNEAYRLILTYLRTHAYL